MNWLTFALLGALAAAATSVLGKAGMANMPSNFAVLVRTVVILVFLAPLVAVQRQYPEWNAVRSRDWWLLILSGLATGLSWLAFFKALQLAPASWVVPVDKLSLVFTLVLAAVFLGEAITPRTAIGAALMVAGALLVAWR